MNDHSRTDDERLDQDFLSLFHYEGAIMNCVYTEVLLTYSLVKCWTQLRRDGS